MLASSLDSPVPGILSQYCLALSRVVTVGYLLNDDVRIDFFDIILVLI